MFNEDKEIGKKSRKNIAAVNNDTIKKFAIGVDGKSIIIANLDANTNQCNVLLTDDQTSTDPTSFDAIVEIKSSKGVLLLPRLTSAQLATITGIPGMLAHEIDNEVLTHVGSDLTFNIIPTISSSKVHTPNSIITFGDDTGSKFADTQVIIDPTTNNMTFPINSSIEFTVGNSLYNFSAPSVITNNNTFVLPNNGSTTGQVLTAIDNLGNTSWAAIGEVNPVISGLTLVESETITVNSAVTAGDLITTGGLVADGTVSAGTLVSLGDIITQNDITGARLNIVGNHTLTLQSNLAQTGNMALVFPKNTGSANQVLTTDGNGNLSWQASTIFTSATTGINTLNGTAGVIINTSAVTANSIINITRNMGTDGPPLVTTIGNLIVGSIINQTSFTVYSTTNNDFGNFNWLIINP